MDKKNVLIIVMAIALTFSIGTMTGINIQQQPITVNSTPQVQNNYTPPNQDITYKPPDQDITVKSSKANYIQANNHEIDFQQTQSGITVDIDDARPLYGTSMRPTIFSGHTLLLEEYTGQELEEGDIITFNTASGATAHRIEGDYTFRENGYYVTRGDNNDGREQVNPENITYIVKGVLYTE